MFGRVPMPSRYDFLKSRFTEQMDYEPRKNIFMGFFPTQTDGHVLSGVVAKRSPVNVSRSEANPFDESAGMAWERTAFFLNLDDDEQVLGVTDNKKVASRPAVLVSKLVQAFNEAAPSAPYKIDVFSLGHERKFWESVDLHNGKVTSLTFDLVVPNPPDTESPTKKALDELKRKIKAKKHKRNRVKS